MGLTRVELLLILFVTALVFSIVLALQLRYRESASRMGCANNLRQIGQAILIYSNDEKGSSSLLWLPTRVPGLQPASAA